MTINQSQGQAFVADDYTHLHPFDPLAAAAAAVAVVNSKDKTNNNNVLEDEGSAAADKDNHRRSHIDYHPPYLSQLRAKCERKSDATNKPDMDQVPPKESSSSSKKGNSSSAGSKNPEAEMKTDGRPSMPSSHYV